MITSKRLDFRYFILIYFLLFLLFKQFKLIIKLEMLNKVHVKINAFQKDFVWKNMFKKFLLCGLFLVFSSSSIYILFNKIVHELIKQVRITIFSHAATILFPSKNLLKRIF